MSFAKYAQFYKENGFFAGSKIEVTVTDNSFIGQELVLTKGSSVIRSTTIPASGKVDFFTDESGILTLSSNNGTSTISGTVNVTNYATYDVALSGGTPDVQRQIYLNKSEVTLNAQTTSDNVDVAYTGDISALTVTSSNPSIATASLNGNRVHIVDAGNNMMGESNVVVRVAPSSRYQEKTATISVKKTNGTLDKTTWIGLKNIVESGREAELCEVGDEIELTLSNGTTMTYIIGAIDHDYDNQIILVPKTYDQFGTLQFLNVATKPARWMNSSLRTYLNTTFYNMLPSDVQGVISERTYQLATSDTELTNVTDKIWMPRVYEVTETTSGAYTKEREAYRINQFQCFEEMLVEFPSSVDTRAWVESPYSNDNYSTSLYIYRATNKYSQSTTNSTELCYILPCFHIIKET